MEHACPDPECDKPYLTDELLARLGGGLHVSDVGKALSVSLCGPGSLGAIAAQSEAIVVKASGLVDEMVKIRQLEDKMFRGLLGAYVEKANAAIIAAMSVFPKKGDKPVTRANIIKALRRADNTFFRGWPSKSLLALNDKVIDETYNLSQQAVLRKAMGAKGYKGDRSLMYKVIATAQIKPSFTLADEAATEWLKGSQKFWVSAPGVWTKADDLITEHALSSIEGMLPEEAGDALEKAMHSKYGTGKALIRSAAYWEGVAANAATTARVSGALREMQQIGVTTYVISNPMDRRTTKICQNMDGKVMQVQSATTVLDELQSKGTTPAAVKKLHPWHPNDFQDRFNKIGVNIKPNEPFPPGKSAAIGKAGFALPPYHFRCRSTVDVSDEVDFASLGTGMATQTATGVVPIPPLKPTAPPVAVPKPKVPKKVASPIPKPQPVAPKTPPVAATPKPAPAKPPKVETTGQFLTSDGRRMDINTMTHNVGRREGGMHTKCFFTDEAGDTWMFKPYSHRKVDGIDQSFRAYGDKMAADTARALGLPTAEVQVAQLPAGHPALRGMGISDGRPVTGSVQRFARGVQGEMGSTSLTALDDVMLAQVQREHAFDFLISNYDSHGANLLRTQEGLLGIDKGQVFRYFGRDSISAAYNPNMRSYGVQTYYNQQFSRYANGELGKAFTMSPENPTMVRFLKAIDDMPDEQYMALVKPYFDEAWEAGIRWPGMKTKAEVLEQALLRKSTLRFQVDDFYDDLNKARNKALGIKAPKAPPKEYRPMNASFMRDLKSGNAKGISSYTPANGQIRSGEILWRAADDDGIIGSFSMHRGGWNSIMRNVGKVDDISAATSSANPAQAAQKAFDTAKAELYAESKKVAKSLNAHMVNEGHSVYDGKIPQHTWATLKSTWNKAENMAASAAPGSAEQALAQHYIDFFKKVTQSSSSTVLEATAPTSAHALLAVKKGTTGAGFIGDPVIKKKLSAVIRAKPAAKVPKPVKKPRNKYEYQVRRTDASKTFPEFHNKGTIKNPRVSWDGETFQPSLPSSSWGGVDTRGVQAYEITFTKTRNPIRVIVADPSGSPKALAGRAKVYIDKTAGKVTATDVKEAMAALDALGLDTKAATLADMEARYLLKVTDQAYPNAIKGGGYSWEAGMPQLSANASAEEIIEEWGAWWAKKLDVGDDINDLRKASNYAPEAMFQQGRMGRGRWSRFDMADEQLDDIAPFICMEQKADTAIHQILDNGTDAFVSNIEKNRYGIQLGGQSPSADVKSGGANRVFSGVFDKDWKKGSYRNSSYYHNDLSTVRFRSAALRDTDGIYFARDNYGAVTDFGNKHAGKTVYDMKRAANGGSNEFLFKQALPLSELDYVPVASKEAKARLIKKLREAGIKPASGKRWESIVQVQKGGR